MHAPTFEDVVAAREFIAPYLPKTPLVRVNGLSELLDCDYYVKLENLQPIGAFKVRGGVNLVGTASNEERQRGLVSASTGNHGQSVAYAGRLFATRVTIYAPAENVNESKMQAMRDLGAEVRFHGRDFDEARQECERFASEEGLRYVHSANEPKLIAGVGTIGLEIFEDLSDVDVIVAPAGGGSCASGNCIVANELNPNVSVVAVQSEAAPAMWHAWRNRTLEPYPIMETEHEGLATRVPFELTNKILWEMLSDFVLVTDAEINDAIRLLARHAKQVAEGAGAASLAGAIKLRDQLRGKKVVGIVSGGNLSLERFAAVLKSEGREKVTMAELLQEYLTTVTGPDGTTYIVRSYGEERTDGTWAGWLEFHPTDVTSPTLRTGQETSQPNRTAIEYWASGLEPVYFEGAFERAHIG